MDPQVFIDNGYDNRAAYVEHLNDEYGSKSVHLVMSMMPDSELFDGIPAMLDDAEYLGILV